MSHYTVMVRVPAVVPVAYLEARVSAALDPYCEHDDRERLLQHFRFEPDDEDALREEYETKSVEMVRLEDGTLVHTWDERFRGKLFERSEPPAHLERVQSSHKERYATFDDFMKGWHGQTRDEQHGKYGSWRNPNAKWDWWQIGGRWRGKLHIKAGTEEAGFVDAVPVVALSEPESKRPEGRADWCRIEALDWASADKAAHAAIAELWAEFDAFLSGREWPPFDGPRETLLNLGVLTCKDAPELTGSEFWKQKWGRQITPGVDRFDVIAEKPDPVKLQERLLAHFSPIEPWAFLDGDGWREKGDMGWFGMSNATPESRDRHADQFRTWLAKGNQRDWIVVVDCHI